jgi:DNA-binding MarR family transcriptional regulator
MDDATERKEPARRSDAAVALGALDGFIGFHLRLAQNASFKAFKRHTGEHDLKPGWFAVMTLISLNPGITPMALSRASGRDKSTITPVLRSLEQRALVERSPVAGDRRSYALTLTPAGRDMLDRLTEHARAHDRQLDAIVGADKPQLIGLLRRIAAEID